eukprot:SAG31_NODE_1647_length_7645_cov_47.639544_10_plen_40_part_00
MVVQVLTIIYDNVTEQIDNDRRHFKALDDIKEITHSLGG